MFVSRCGGPLGGSDAASEGARPATNPDASQLPRPRSARDAAPRRHGTSGVLSLHFRQLDAPLRRGGGGPAHSRPTARSTLQPTAPPATAAVSSDDDIWGWGDANRCKDALTDAEARAVDLFAKRLFFAPVNVGNMHWCLAAVDMELKTVRYYDSMGGSGSAYLRALMRYLGDEHQDKRGSPFDAAGWTKVTTTPVTLQQSNGFDCGVFASYCAHYVSLGAKPSFSQQDILHLRRRMMADILAKRIHGS
ncbi:hypothetical protein M885DRAFT_625901 [Pelagophyceae sp. CCMP2097]|nr:hypothetical protein M885DRAFT_625901 [Pelagophyceae sp. CCMP2097]